MAGSWAIAFRRFGGLRGVFGIDAIVRNGVPWPVEVNPRYTASVEVIEIADRASCAHPLTPGLFQTKRGGGSKMAKGVYYAPRNVMIPESGPWDDDVALWERI